MNLIQKQYLILKKGIFLEMDEIIGAVGIEDTIIDDEIEDLEDAGKRKSSFTGIKGETND